MLAYKNREDVLNDSSLGPYQAGLIIEKLAEQQNDFERGTPSRLKEATPCLQQFVTQIGSARDAEAAHAAKLKRFSERLELAIAEEAKLNESLDVDDLEGIDRLMRLRVQKAVLFTFIERAPEGTQKIDQAPP